MGRGSKEEARPLGAPRVVGETRILCRDELECKWGLQAGLRLLGCCRPDEGLSGDHTLKGMEDQGGMVLDW